MAIRLDISDDFESVCNDFLEAATLKLSTGDVTLQSVLTDPHQMRELEPTGGYVTRLGTNFVWSKKRSSRPPLGTVIVDHEGTYWTIWKMEDKQHVDTWEAFCLNLNIVTADFNDALILKAEYGKGWANEAKAEWRGLFSNKKGGRPKDHVPARFQQSEETAELEFGAEWRRETYRVYFQEPVPVEASSGDYRLVDSNGYRYRMMKYYMEHRIDRLPVAICVRITEGSEYFVNPGPD